MASGFALRSKRSRSVREIFEFLSVAARVIARVLGLKEDRYIS
jgi:hypothetical protein